MWLSTVWGETVLPLCLGERYLNSHTTTGNTKEETEDLYEKYLKFEEEAKVLIKTLLFLIYF